MRTIYWLALAGVAAVAGCGAEQEDAPEEPTTPQAQVVMPGPGYEEILPEDLERGRLDTSWQEVVELDSIGPAGEELSNPETWEQLSAESVNQGTTHLPLYGDVAGPSVLKTQILLDRALFSPGILDGRWGKNTEKAIYWLQRREGLRATGRMDRATFERLVQLAGNPQRLVRTHQLSEEEVSGPFVEIPEDIYEKAELECLCYESLSEKLAELFHTTPDLLRKLNPEVELDSLSAGDALQVPNVREPDAGRGAPVARLVVSDRGHFVHAMDASGRIVYHFPSTLGSSFDPSPKGDLKVVKITRDPWWHYQPAILEHVDNSEPDAKIPPGPNNAVGRVWMALSKEHYGIHGTSAPETIGYATSAGCVRLTNWDALFLADRIEEGVPVQFRDPSSAEGAAVEG